MMNISRREIVSTALLHYWWTTLPLLFAMQFSISFLKPNPNNFHLEGHEGQPFTNWDGQWYRYVAVHGYFYDQNKPSSIAFFPAFPLVCRCLASVSGLDIDYAMIVVSNAFLAGTFVLLSFYVRHRYKTFNYYDYRYTLVAFGVYPTSFFFRMGYTESMFLFIVTLFIYLIEIEAPLIAIAMVGALASATRSTGIALVFPLLVQVLNRSRSTGVSVRKVYFLIPISISGLLVFMVYQYYEFGNPFAFAESQNRFKDRPSPPLIHKMFYLATLEPIRSLFTSTSLGYWRRFEIVTSPLFSLHVADPFFFISAVAIATIGFRTKVLNLTEFILSLALVLIPYFSIGCETYMRSQGRYSSTAVPIYFVIGHFLSRVPGSTASGFLIVSCIFMFIYASLFMAGYMLI